MSCVFQNLDKTDDVRKYVIRRQIVKDGKKPYYKAPKIQRLITPQRLRHKRERKAVKRARYEHSKADVIPLPLLNCSLLSVNVCRHV